MNDDQRRFISPGRAARLKVMASQLAVLLPQAGIRVRLSPHDSALMRDRLVILAGGR